MAALSEDIVPAMREATIVTVESGEILMRFPGARDGSKAPAGGYCDNAPDAQAVLEARALLIAQQGRRRFGVKVQDELLPDLDAGIPTYRLIDDEHVADAAMLVGRIEVDFEEETTTLELFG